MTDALRTDRQPNPDLPDRERDARIEELLLAGLHHYFAGQYELAVNVWSRVLFLDRSHGKARAYIERARGALAERQRAAEELLHTGADALIRGDRAAARALLTSAERAGGDDALALLHRLDRLEAAEPARVRSRTSSPARPHRDDGGGVSGREARLAWIITGIATGILLAALAGGYFWLAEDPFELTVARSGTPAADEPSLPVPATCDIRLARAKLLVQDGRLHEAQALLEAGDPDALHGAAFDELRATIQRRLIDAGRRGAGFSTPAPAAGGRGEPAVPSSGGPR